MEKEKSEMQESSTQKVVAGESIGIKEGECIGLGLRNMQTQADIEKRKKKRKKKILITLLIFLILLCGVVAVYLKKQAEADADTVESSEDVVVEENQELVFGEITSIRGNEITYDLVEEDTSDSNVENADSVMPTSGHGGDANMPNGNPQETTEVSMSEKATQSTDAMSYMNVNENAQDTTEDNSQGISDGMMPVMIPSKTFHSLGEKPVEVTIPVGTDVITKLGTTTTFARLATGDVVQMLMEKDGNDEVIVKMWIVG